MNDRRMSPEQFAKQRAEALATWPTGAAVDLEEAFAYQRGHPRGAPVFAGHARRGGPAAGC